MTGFWVQVEWFWREPLPPVIETLAELGLVRL